MSDQRNDEDVRRAMNPDELTNVQAMGAWDAVIEDMEATVTAYEQDGWHAVSCHPGDVTVVTGDDRSGIDVLLPDNEYADVSSLVESATFDEYEILRAEHEGVVYGVVVMQDTAAKHVFCFPIFFEPDEFVDVVDDSVTVYLRRLNDEFVELELDNPGLFLPDTEF